MSEIEIVSMRPFSTVDAKGERQARTLVTYRDVNGALQSTTIEGTVRDVEQAATAVREG